MLSFPDPRATVQAQDAATMRWHQQETIPPTQSGLEASLMTLHRANFDLWHLEDAARDPRATDREIVECKRSIDRTNQQRNDCVEQIDTTLLAALSQNERAPLHTETPGMIFDRLSILSLKLFHTEEERTRTSATEEHRTRNGARLEILRQQRSDLEDALAQLFEEIAAGRRRFKLYRQMKMYNDPTLNPVLYTGASDRKVPQA